MVMKSLISDPNHVPQKKNKVIKELPNGTLIPKEMQKMSAKGWKEVKDVSLHNKIIGVINFKDPMYRENQLELYWIGNVILILETAINTLWHTKDSNPEELTEDYWKNLIK